MDTAYNDSDRRPSRATVSEADQDLLDEIRDRYKQWDSEWSRIRDERNTDIRYICGNPWTDRDRKAREDAGRPCINHDELNQYVHQCVNGVRQNKRGIKVDPKGEGSNDQTALLRQDLIRTIENDSNGPSVYAKAYQDVVEGSYAFFRISRRYVCNDANINSPSIFDQEIVIKPIANPNSVLFDPRCKEPDWSDARGCFVIERISKKEFRRRWPKAEVTDFDWQHTQIATDWIMQDDVIVAEYWRVEVKETQKYELESGEIVDSPKGQRVVRKRKVPVNQVMQYVTNGIEILERSEEPEPGAIIPIIPMIGLERYVDDGGFSRRVLFSLVRLARDPQMSLAYLNSQEMEEAGLSPKTPFIGYKGQFDSSREQWATVTKQPYAFLESDIPDNWPAGQIPPLPTRVPFTPNFQSYEVAKDSCRRAIQAAMGITPLPTAAQRNNEKSGIALQRIETLEAIGSYHFVDGYDRALRLAGKVIDQWIPSVYGRQRTLQIRKPDDSYRQIQLNTEEPYPDVKTGEPVQYPVEQVDHSTTISTAPSYASQREAVSDFLDGLIGQLPNLPIAPPQAAKLLALAIQMKDMGPKGDQMAEIISPTDGQDQGQMQLQQAQAQSQMQQMQIQQLSAALQQVLIQQQGKVIDNEYKIAIEQMKADTNEFLQKMKSDTQIAVAEIGTKSQLLNERIAAIDEVEKQGREHLQEHAIQQQEHDHEIEVLRHEYLNQALEAANQPKPPESPQQ